ncbi:MAG TPA: hypothetical protein VD968_09600 [Pyrinomonadaceae bacterium]|nr:hypothetical protein [Pyrinomonadaceae bacterium]
MVSRKTQSRAGAPERRRGQQMGDERSRPDKSIEEKRETPAARGRRKAANKFFADESFQNVASDGEAPRDNTPSIPAAVPTGTKLGESGGEREFKQRQKKK